MARVRMRSAGRAPLVAALLAGALAASPAAAQPAPSASVAASAPPAIVPPKATTPLTAAYPEGAEGDATVVLLVEIGADGTVVSATPERGVDPFATAAATASASWRFEPATRGGVAMASRIRVEVRFIAPPPPATPPAPPSKSPGKQGSAATPPPPPPPPEPLEVTVRGEALAPGAASMSRAEVRLLPGAFGDPFRAVDALAGVTPLASGVPFFFVRGAPPGNVGYFLDGIRVPLLYHIGLGPSVVHPAIVDRVDLHRGGYPARYGRFAGGIVAGETKAAPDELHMEGNLRVVDIGGMVEAPFAGGRGSAFAAGRYSYTGALLSLISSSVSVDYWDYQARATFRPTPRSEVSIFAFGAHDYFGQKHAGEPTETVFDTTFHRLDLRYERALGGPDERLRHAITLGWDQTFIDSGRYVRDRMIASRTEVTRRLADNVLLRAGLDAVFDTYEADLFRAGDDAGRDEFSSLFSSRPEVVMGARADAVIQVTPRFEVIPGLRVDLFESNGNVEIGFDPRVAARLAITPRVRLVQAHGVASQAPSFFLPGPGFQRGLGGGLQRSFQSSAGVEVDLPLDIDASLTLFRNAFFNMTDPLGTAQVTGANPPETFDQRSLGSSIGMELAVHRRLTRKLGGFLSYTLSRSVRAFDRTRVVSSFDRTHVLNLALGYDFGRGYRAGTRVLFYTGTPQSAPGYQVPPGTRLPPFFRLDVRLEKRWTIGKNGWISPVIEVLNTTLSKEVVAITCSDRNGCKESVLGPVTIPSIGVEAGF